MKKNRNISSTLTIYLLASEALLAMILIITGYWFAKNIVIENLSHKLRYYTEQVLDPIQDSMEDTAWLISNLATEFDTQNAALKPETYASSVFKVHPEIVALRFVFYHPNDTNRIDADCFSFNNGDSLRTNKKVFFQDFPLSENWMDSSTHRNSSEWSPPFYSDTTQMGFNQILIYSHPVVINSEKGKKKGIIFCAISLDKELQSLGQLDIFKHGFPVLISNHGEIIYPAECNNKINKDPVISQWLSKLDIHKIIQGAHEDYEIIRPIVLDKKKSIALYWPLQKINCIMVAIIPVTEYMSFLNRTLFLAIFIVLFFGGISAAVAIYFSRKLVAPITTLADASRKMVEEEGIKNPHLYDEVDILSKSIDLMKRKLRNYEKERLKTEFDNEEMDKELKLAREIEMSIVPTKFPLFPGRTDFDCYGKLLPAKIVGGDLFDFFLLDDTHLFLSICDTLGKGIPAAMFAVATRTMIRSLAKPNTRLGKIMESLNDELSLGHDSDMYVTIMMGCLDLSTGELAYCNAGHPRPFILRNNNQIEEFDITHGFPIGVRRKQKYIETIVKLNPGETMIAYTDGITEEADKAGIFFGKERLYSIVQAHNSASPEKFVKEVLKNLDKFRGKKEIYDDTTILALQYIGKGIPVR